MTTVCKARPRRDGQALLEVLISILAMHACCSTSFRRKLQRDNDDERSFWHVQVTARNPARAWASSGSSAADATDPPDTTVMPSSPTDPLNSGPCGDILSGTCWAQQALIASIVLVAVAAVAAISQADKVRLEDLLLSTAQTVGAMSKGCTLRHAPMVHANIRVANVHPNENHGCLTCGT